MGRRGRSSRAGGLDDPEQEGRKKLQFIGLLLKQGKVPFRQSCEAKKICSIQNSDVLTLQSALGPTKL